MEGLNTGPIKMEKISNNKETKLRSSTVRRQTIMHIENVRNRIVIVCVIISVITVIALMTVFIPRNVEEQKQLHVIKNVMQPSNLIAEEMIHSSLQSVNKSNLQNDVPISPNKKLRTNRSNKSSDSMVHQVLNLTEQKSLITTSRPPSTIYQDPLYATHSPEFLKIPIFRWFTDIHDRGLRQQKLLWMIEPLEKARNYLSYIITKYENLKKSGIKYEVYINDEGKSSFKITDPNKVFHEAQKHFDELQNLKEIKYDLIKVLTAIKERVANLEEWETPYYQK